MTATPNIPLDRRPCKRTCASCPACVSKRYRFVKVVPATLKQPLALGGFVGAAFVEVTLLALYAALEMT